MNFVSFQVIGPGEADRYLKPCLEQLPKLADKIAICLNNADPKTKKLCADYADLLCEDNREWGRHQNRIKQDFLVNRVAKLEPDWVLCLDGDEVYDKRFTRERAEELASSPTDVAYQFWCIQLWNDERHWRRDLSFPNIRFYKFLPEYGLHFHNAPLHCGLAPEYAYKLASQSNLIFRHYGLMRPEERARKVARYDRYDPTAKYKAREWYEALKNESYVPDPFEENEQFYAKLPELIHRKKLPTMTKKERGQIYLFRNPHGRIIPAEGEKTRDQYLKTPGFTLVQEVINSPRVEAPVVKAEEPAREVIAPEPAPKAEKPKRSYVRRKVAKTS